jgi:uncharacterized membrane protein HdeD (DUF308 family)
VARREHESPAFPATVAVVLGAVAFYQGLIVPPNAVARHVLLGACFGVVGVLAGWRAVVIARRNGARVSGWFGVVAGLLGLGMLVYQVLVIVTNGAVPPPFWAPYARRA